MWFIREVWVIGGGGFIREGLVYWRGGLLEVVGYWKGWVIRVAS